MKKLFTEAELMELEKYWPEQEAVLLLTNYIRCIVGTVEIPPFPPKGEIELVLKSIRRHRRKAANAIHSEKARRAGA